jgi:Undecaprenyl-phosphate galactose phosphotransferase WbaP
MTENSAELKPTDQALQKTGRFPRQWMSIALALTDLVSLLLAFSLAILFRVLILGTIPLNQFYSLWPVFVFFILAFAWRGLYPAVGMSPVDELRLTTSTSSLVFLILIAGTFWLKITGSYSRMILTVAWLLSLVLIQGGRWLLRIVSRRYWGEPIAIFGDGPVTKHIFNFLFNNIHLGMRPAIVFHQGMPFNPSDRKVLREKGINTALLVTPEVSQEVKDSVITDGRYRFRRVILISDLGWVGSLGVETHDLEGILGMEVRQNLLNFWQRGLKRSMDMLLAVMLLVLLFPLLLIIAIAIKVEDKGEVFYKQSRVGRKGHPFTIWKFRTMVPNADLKLQEYLGSDPQFQKEWDSIRKIKKDPRLTRAGRFLRIWSLDELPQLINVLRGEMSLVGPRPFLPEEIKFYGSVLGLYYRIRPGITGMWQISGRNEAIYSERVRLDEYYIRNWSIWLDFYILIRTVWVVLQHKGAY